MHMPACPLHVCTQMSNLVAEWATYLLGHDINIGSFGEVKCSKSLFIGSLIDAMRVIRLAAGTEVGKATPA